jgi:hypothetical protein
MIPAYTIWYCLSPHGPISFPIWAHMAPHSTIWQTRHRINHWERYRRIHISDSLILFPNNQIISFNHFHHQLATWCENLQAMLVSWHTAGLKHLSTCSPLPHWYSNPAYFLFNLMKVVIYLGSRFLRPARDWGVTNPCFLRHFIVCSGLGWPYVSQERVSKALVMTPTQGSTMFARFKSIYLIEAYACW